MQQSLTRELAEFVAGLDFDDLPPNVIDKAKDVLLDALGCAMAAFKEDRRKAGIATEIAQQFGAGGPSTVIGGGRAHPALAALSNGILINAADNDDTHKRALIHVGSVVVPAALASTEASSRSGRELLVALVAGYEVATRVGMAVMPSHYKCWHSTATNGTFGSAAASARALSLSAEDTCTCLGFAGTQAAGLNAFFESGDDSKSVHPGKAGLNGVLAAVLTQLGATSPPDILGHPKGYLAAFSDEPKAHVLTNGLGTDWEILQNGFKPYPSILASHSPIGASLDIRSRESLDPKAIESVEIRTYATVKSHFSSKEVRNGMSARLSVPYCVAAALVDGEITQRQFRPERYTDQDVLRLLDKVEVTVDPELSPLYPDKFPARVIVVMQDGRQLESTFLYPKGDPQNPLTREELERKFRDNVDGVMKPESTEKLLAMIRSMESCDFNAFSSLLGKDGLHHVRT
ncbi:MAG: MmgE/PrpD family protein [Ectothiorhodospiraceae bacterium]|nr:MmgE/PrpD family protein [Ectothiorhodospiraceae bacterium]